MLIARYLLFFVIVSVASMSWAASKTDRVTCVMLLNFLEGDKAATSRLGDPDQEQLRRTEVSLHYFAKAGETPTQTLQRLFARDYGIPNEHRPARREQYLSDPAIKASLGPGSMPTLNFPFNETIRVRSTSEDLVVVQVDYARKTLIQNYVETSFFNLSQMLVPFVYRRSRLVQDELHSTMKLMDRVLDSQDLYAYFFGFHPTIWRSYVRRLNAILSENSIPDVSDENAWSRISEKIHSVWQPLYPSFVVLAAYPDFHGQFRIIDNCEGCKITFVGLVRNDEPDPMELVSEDLKPSSKSGVEFYLSVVSALPPSSEIELQSHTRSHDRFYQKLGFKFVRDEPNALEWPQHVGIKTFGATREEILSVLQAPVQ